MNESDNQSNAITQKITIRNRYGLHARPAAQFVELCNRFESEILLSKDPSMEVSGKNILDVMMLGAGRGTELELRVTGIDAEAAIQALIDLVENNFGENG